jgi:hypothetical protein|tara:strand:- start:862 stop:1131 length:270 start_codon:yes stop_codon:yes gene_type:complete
MIETMNEVLDKVLADNLVETIANMNEEQRDKFVDTFVSKWPLLAGQISFNIESNLKDVEVKNPALRLDPNKKAYIQKVKQEDREVMSVN